MYYVKNIRLEVYVTWKISSFTYVLRRYLAQIHSGQILTNINYVSFPYNRIDL